MPKPTPKKSRKAGTSKASAEKKKALFIEAMLSNNGNKRQAALAAGYKGSMADKMGQVLSKDVEVISKLDEAQAKIMHKYRLGAEDVFRSLAQELRFNPKGLYNAEGGLRDITDLADDVAMVLTGVDFEQTGGRDAPVFIRKVKWAQKYGAREQLMKHLGMFKEDNNQRTLLVVKDLTGRG